VDVVVYEDDPTRGKDAPSLSWVVTAAFCWAWWCPARSAMPPPGLGRDRFRRVGLRRPASWVRLDRVLDVPEEGIRREGAILAREIFDVVAARLRADYAWR